MDSGVNNEMSCIMHHELGFTTYPIQMQYHETTQNDKNQHSKSKPVLNNIQMIVT